MQGASPWGLAGLPSSYPATPPSLCPLGPRNLRAASPRRCVLHLSAMERVGWMGFGPRTALGHCASLLWLTPPALESSARAKCAHGPRTCFKEAWGGRGEQRLQLGLRSHLHTVTAMRDLANGSDYYMYGYIDQLAIT